MAEEPDEFEDDFAEDEEDLGQLDLQLKTDDLVRRFEDDQHIYETMVEKPVRTRKILSKYEKARMIGVRAQQIQSGAKPLVYVGEERDPIKIAMMEADQQVIPMLIKRKIPGRDPHKPRSEVVSPNNIVSP